jgi:hypothetical protein
MSYSPPTQIHHGISDMKSLLLSPPVLLDSASSQNEREKLVPSPEKNCNGNSHESDENKIEIQNSDNCEDHNDGLIQKVSSWIAELTVIRENLERASVENVICLDSLYMTGAIDD